MHTIYLTLDINFRETGSRWANRASREWVRIWIERQRKKNVGALFEKWAICEKPRTDLCRLRFVGDVCLAGGDDFHGRR